MNEEVNAPAPSQRRTWLLCGALFFAAIAVLLVWASRRETTTEKLIKQKLAELRAAGEPTTAGDLAKKFPDPSPEDDALILYAPSLAIATNNRVPPQTPIILGNSFPVTQPIGTNLMAQLIAFCEATAAIASALPTNSLATFPMHWSLGFTNRKTGVGVNYIAARSLSHTITAHAITAAERGDAETATQFIVQGFHFNRALPYAGALVQHMIRHAVDNLMCDATERALNRTTFSEVQLRRIANAIDEESLEDLRNCYQVERCMMNFYFDWAKAGGSEDLIMGYKPRSVWMRMWERIKPRQSFYKDEDYLLYLEHSPAEVDWSGEPLEILRQARQASIDYNRKTVSHLGKAVYPNFPKPLIADFDGRARTAVAKAAISVERYRLAHKRNLPTTALASDPIVAQPLHLKLLPVGFMVYSVGSDGVDNGGITRTNSTGQTNNYDITFSIER